MKWNARIEEEHKYYFDIAVDTELSEDIRYEATRRLSALISGEKLPKWKSGVLKSYAKHKFEQLAKVEEDDVHP